MTIFENTKTLNQEELAKFLFDFSIDFFMEREGGPCDGKSCPAESNNHDSCRRCICEYLNSESTDAQNSNSFAEFMSQFPITRADIRKAKISAKIKAAIVKVRLAFSSKQH